MLPPRTLKAVFCSWGGIRTSPSRRGGGDGCFQALHSDVTVIPTNLVVIQCGLLRHKARVTLQPERLEAEACQD